MAVLACWLGLSLLVRAPREPATLAFAWLCLHLTLYGLGFVLPPLARQEVRGGLMLIQVVETVLLPPVFLHFIGVLVGDGPAPRWQLATLALFYAAGLAMAAYALFSSDMVVLADGSLSFPAGLRLLWTAQRVLPLLLSLLLMFLNYHRAGGDRLERRRRVTLGLSATVGVIGALWATAARDLRWTPAPGHALMGVALALLAYAVLAYRSLLSARVARRAFYRSLLGGVLTGAYVSLLLAAESIANNALGLEAPLVPAFAFVALIAVFGPLRDWAGAWLDRRFFHREFDYGKLLRALSNDLFQRGDLPGQLEAALGSICRTLGVASGAVAVQQGSGLHVLATYGDAPPATEAFRGAVLPDGPRTHYDDWEPWPVARLLLPLRSGQEELGLLALGPKRSGDSYRDIERALLLSLGSYLASAIKHARNQQEEELALAALAEQSRQLQHEQELLVTQAAEAARLAAQPAPAPSDEGRGLRVLALGPLRVERDGKPIERWGGEKAGTYQAEALFAVLFDRRGRGLTKDEAEELIWPDLEMDKADMAFHRTISALRRTLEPGLRRGNESRMITYHHERYWLDPATVGWCDADAFAAAAERGHTLLRQGDLEAARESFAAALALYRGDYMDDCPFFGDSSHVEGRRAELRDQQIDVLLALGAVYERLGRAGEAATCYRRAIAASPEECPRAEEGLARLQVSAA
jgi:DNA-binding SARP family transcriptional activator